MDNKQASLIRRGFALRAKYRVNERYVKVAPNHIGFHPANRNERWALRVFIVRRPWSRFDANEADCNGILAQETPRKTIIHDSDMQSCDGNDHLAPSVEGSVMSYGSLSHSHLIQVFKNILDRLLITGIKTSNSSGRLDLSTLGEVDAAFAKHCKDGLLLDVLSHKILYQGPSGLNVIQAACNSKNSIALTQHKIEDVASLRSIVKHHPRLRGRWASRALRNR
jgi:hypothetical protein